MIKYLFILLVFFFLVELYFHYKFIKKIKKDLPSTINSLLKEDIILPEIVPDNITPKKLYRTYYDLEIAKNFSKAHKITKETNPELEEIIYDDNMIDNYIKNNYSQRIYKAYKSINPVYGPARADFFRYLIIYKEGGVYLDIKSALVKNIDKEINKNKLVISKGRYNLIGSSYGLISQKLNSYNWSRFSGVKYYGEYSNWIIISPKKNKILGLIIKQMVSNIEYGLENKNKYNNGEYSVLALTGPIMFSRIINKYKKDKNIVFTKTNLNWKAVYSLYNINHKNIENGKKHYSKIKEKNILIK